MKTKSNNSRKHNNSSRRAIKLRSMEIRNFRLLKKVAINFEERITLIVGRNNSGKTTIMDLIGRLFSGTEPKFELEDFSVSSYRRFWNAFKLKQDGANDDLVCSKLPSIKIKLTLEYDVSSPDLGSLSDCIIDLDPDCNQVVLEIAFGPMADRIGTLLDGQRLNGDRRKRQKTFFSAIRQRLEKCYGLRIESVAPNDPTNRKIHKWNVLPSIIRGDLISAQRGLDNQSHNVLGRILEKLFSGAELESADSKQKEIARQLDEAVEKVQTELGEHFNLKLAELLPAFSMFGYPGLSDPELVTETSFNTTKLLKEHTKVLYSGHSGVDLPENLNGLGTRNLIYMLLRLYAFFQSYRQQSPATGVHLICIEEPEAHLHPQMQEVFIRQIELIIDLFGKEMNDGNNVWPVQLVISTHSSHIANEAYFESIRYFLAMANDNDRNGFRNTRIADLRIMFDRISEPTKNFIHKYMTLTRCDLFFADKAILIEGPTERILLPKMIEKIDSEPGIKQKLSSQYIAVMEIGGAYAHQFFDFLNFLEVPSLIITDIDSIKAKQNRACRVSEGVKTSNETIKQWFKGKGIDMTPGNLVKLSDDEKIIANKRLAYQVPEEDCNQNSTDCGRSFEDAFVIANLDHFRRQKPSKQNSHELYAWNYVRMLKKKTEFAIRYAITDTDWNVPRYIAEGLRWLADAPCQTFTRDRLPERVARSRPNISAEANEDANA